MTKNINQHKYQNCQYPPKDKEILAELTDPNCQGGSFMLPKSASSLDRAKHEICQSIVSYLLENNLEEGKIASQLELSKAEVKRLLRCHIEEFTLDRLVSYLDKLHLSLQTRVVENKLSA